MSQNKKQDILRCLVDEIWHEHPHGCKNCEDNKICLEIINKFRDTIIEGANDEPSKNR